MLLATTAQEAAKPPVATQVPDDVNTCILCHTTPEFFKDEKQKFFLSKEYLSGDAHLKRGVRCHDCHGGNPSSLNPEKAHSNTGESPSLLPFGEMAKSCGKCHEDEYAGLASGVHKEASKGEGGVKTPLTCKACHGGKTHGILAVSDPNSPVFGGNQVKLCGKCHEEELIEYDKSVHGHALHHSGLLAAAMCADCHDAHAIFPAQDKRSTLHTANVAGTCSKCHRFIEERLRHSVHGGGVGLGEETDDPAPGGEIKRHPSCTDCHEGHDLPHPNSAAFRLQSADRCGKCHVNLFRSYGFSMHGKLTDLGHVPGAKCSDCHGGHDILPITDPRSRLALGEQRLATCRNCHTNSVANFCNFIPHADHHDSARHPILYAVFISMELLIYSVFVFFGIHTVLWLVRSLIHVYRHGRPRRLTPGARAYVRFEPIHRILHAVVALSFLGLALTGLPLRYSTQPWAQSLVFVLGGFESTGIWHRICGVVTILYLVTHLTWLASQTWKRRKQGHAWGLIVFGPDSPVPNLRDGKDMYRMFRWFLGMGPKPVFERWTYWEKFDYWAVFWGVGIIGSTGLLLWFPNIFCLLLPGETLNLAKIIHSEEALLATSFIFAIHFFGTHLRPEKFPIDMSVLSGMVSEEEMLEERLDFMERMRQQERLGELETTLSSRRQLIPVALVGFAALAVGLLLLTGILMAIFGA